jgi:hypothetical protein
MLSPHHLLPHLSLLREEKGVRQFISLMPMLGAVHVFITILVGSNPLIVEIRIVWDVHLIPLFFPHL